MSEDRRRTKKQPIDPTYGHIQPQAPEVEKAVLGALMIDKDAYVEVCEIPRVLSSSVWLIIGMSTLPVTISSAATRRSISLAPAASGTNA